MRPRARLREERPGGYHGALVYDGDCPFTSAAVTTPRRDAFDMLVGSAWSTPTATSE